ncbi:MAG: ATP synthase F1 subunit epsilon [Rhodothermales bacterium]
MASNLYVDIVSPTGSVFKGEAERVRAPGIQGAFEILHNHAPMIAAIELGPLFITLPSGDRISFATSGGFVEVLNNTVTVLAETAEPASEIDIERAKESEARALEQMNSGDEAEKRRARQSLERARLRMSMGNVGSKRS